MPLDDADPRSLVPLHTLQHTLFRQLYPFHLVHNPAMAASVSPPPLSHSPPDDPPTEPAPAPAPSSQDPSQRHDCHWLECTLSFPDPEALYNHLCNDHIGRKSTGNLCLTCKWKDCGTTCAKRDHITSHLRVHTPLKPHVCLVCKKPFKRPQDLKKHEKIHTEEHHAQHKHSKAITIPDSYSPRVPADSPDPSVHRNRALNYAIPPHPAKLHVPVARVKSASLSASDRSTGPEYALLPTPSPEIEQAAVRYPNVDSASHPTHRNHPYQMQTQLPTWEVLTHDGSPSRITGAKRSYEDDYSVDDLLSDMKRRRVNPAYDSNMAARLNTLVYHQQQVYNADVANPPSHQTPSGMSSHSAAFNPRHVSFDIRSPEELAAVNDFLLTLGRDVAGQGTMHRQHPSQLSQPAAQDLPAEQFFDPVALSHLGLAGMPGIPTMPGPGSGSSYHGDSYMSVAMSAYHLPPRPTHPSVQQPQYTVYPPDGVSVPTNYRSPANYGHFTPPLDGVPRSHGLPSPVSPPHSSMSTPSNSTPPHMRSPHLPILPEMIVCQPPKAPPVVQLDQWTYINQPYKHTIIPLKSARTSNAIPEPIEPKVDMNGAHIGPPAKLTSASVFTTSVPKGSSSTSNGKSLYPLLEGDKIYKLPPLQRYRSPSPPASEATSSPMSRAATISPQPRSHPMSSSRMDASEEASTASASSTASPSPEPTVLPGIQSIAPSATAAARGLPRGRDSEELAHAVGRIELDNRKAVEITPARRLAHARLVRDLLVSINEDYRRRFGTPPPPPPLESQQAKAAVAHREELRDVDMVGA